MDEQPRLTLSVAETAAFLEISRNFCYELVRRREIPAIRFGPRLTVPKKALNDLLTIGVPLGQGQEPVDIRCPKSASGRAH
jgi:excisionase family DNA binding protein